MTGKEKKRLLLLIAIGVLLVGVVAILPYRLIIVSGESMSPTYHSGDWLVGRRQTFHATEPFRRGEVVLFHYNGETMLKRIYALPGDEVVIFRLDEGFNLLVQANEYLKYYRLVEEIGVARIHRFDVPPDELFLLGDAPIVSLDSRAFGPVPQSTVIARVLTGAR